MEQFFFYIFAGVAVASAIGVITAKNPVHSAVFLIICLLQVAALYILLRAPFLAAVQVFIYVGAVMVLFLFVVMVLDVGKERLKKHIHGQRAAAIPVLILFLGAAGYLLSKVKWSQPVENYSETTLMRHTEVLGKLLYTKYVFPFEVVSVLLLVALIGAIVLVMKRKDSGEPSSFD